MFSYIDKLRKKPVAEREEFTKNFTVLFMVIVVGIWILFNFVHLSFESAPSNVDTGDTRILGPYE